MSRQTAVAPHSLAHKAARRNSGRRGLGTLIALLLVIGLAIVIASELHHAVGRLGLPLSHSEVIREEATAKRLDPALVAAVIYAESKFEPRPSSAGAEGLMQILPETAYFIAHLSGGTAFTASDLATPRINVAYGTYYLRYLLDHYDGDEMLAIAAYNAGLANVDRWVAQAYGEGKTLTVAAIPFPETRAYVERVLSAQQDYRASYARQLGLH
jgi:soluble lytic murein transglycosylase